MKKTIGIFAHVDSGKTTFSEQLLYQTQAIRTLGRVDHKSAFLDTHGIEKERGITIFAEQAYFQYGEDTYYLVDTPGHVDFCAEMARTIQMIDYAIIIISALDGVQSHTETIYELLETAQVPVFFFVNKMDVPHGDFDKSMEGILTLAPGALDFSGAFTMTQDFLEGAAEKDEDLMNLYFEYQGPTHPCGAEQFKTQFTEGLVKAIKNRLIMPVFKGAALKNEGIDDFLEGLRCYTKPQEGLQQGPLSGVVYKIRYDHKQQRQTFIKLFRGSLKVRDYLGDEKITEIRLHQGPKVTSVGEVFAGDVFSVIGIKNFQAGQRIGDVANDINEIAPSVLAQEHISQALQPNLKSRMTFAPTVNPKDLFQKIKLLEEEDPFLNVILDEKSRAITLGIMGTIQLEVLKTIILERFGFEIDFEEPTVIYRETISSTAVGYGHFEPLRHYAEVHLLIEPGESGSGVTFFNNCPAEHLSLGNQTSIRNSLLDKVHRGVLTGSDLTDIKVTLLTGRGHLEHTASGDFREASIRALRQGLEQVENVLLEPLYHVAITVANQLVGRVMTDLVAMHGTNLMATSKGDVALVEGSVPVATFKDYAAELASLSSGHGRLRLKAAGYAPCHNPDSVIEKIDYNRERDVDYPSSSVFCAKGKGYIVPWDQAKEHMHCQ